MAIQARTAIQARAALPAHRFRRRPRLEWRPRARGGGRQPPGGPAQNGYPNYGYPSPNRYAETVNGGDYAYVIDNNGRVGVRPHPVDRSSRPRPSPGVGRGENA